jgi:guanylate kinase
MMILSSPSGAGKTTLTGRLLETDKTLALSISATTRAPRPGEIDGVHYFFLDHATFEARREADDFLEWAEVFGNLYGTPRGPVEAVLAEGRDIVFDIDWQGARALSSAAPADVVRVFILPPSRATLKERLRARAADSEEVVARRMAGATEEISHWDEYDYVLINDDLDVTLGALQTILAAERLRRERRPALGAFAAELLRDEAAG